nr:MAG TPA: hypothetical protein [Caudoviricetes sp.]
MFSRYDLIFLPTHIFHLSFLLEFRSYRTIIV